MDRKTALIMVLAALVVVLAATVMFLAGRSNGAEEGRTAEPATAPPADRPAAAAPGAADSSTGAAPAAPLAAPAPDPAPAAEDPRTIPAAFHGEWNARPEHCGTGLNDSALKIEPGVMRFYESRGDVTRVTRTGPRSVKVEARFEGEGETWNETVEMNLSEDGATLTTGVDQARRRCR